jgi:HlyD family secretion protein
MKKLLLILVVIWGCGAAGYWYYNDVNNQRVAFRTVAVNRGDLLATINATGTLEPQETVDVGVQIAGEIQSFGQDANDPSKPINCGSRVEQGTVLARLDDSLLKARVNQARASVEKSKADVQVAEAKLGQAERDLERVRKLHAKHTVAIQEYDAATTDCETAKANLAVARSAVAIAEANLEEANVNLRYTTIQSPVKGVVLDRRVNIGQTVVASLNAPSLFLIAKDLSRMEIWASVNETDVGAIHVGQGVRFTVSAFPRDEFRGRVSQIRLNATMTQSVVTYTVVVDFDNPSGKLLPYLTARLQFEVDDRKNVLLVPNAALRWEPKLAQVAPEARAEFEKTLRQRAAAPRGDANGAKGETKERKRGNLWVKTGEFVTPIPVTLGVTDGLQTEINSGEIQRDSEVVVGVAANQTADDGASPFLPKLKNAKAKK